MKKILSIITFALSFFLVGCISRQSSRVCQYKYKVACCVHDEQFNKIPEACMLYGFEMPKMERQIYGGATRCSVAASYGERVSLIKTNIVQVKDSGPLLKGWGDLTAFIVAPGYAPVVWDGQHEVVLIKTDEFEGVYSCESRTSCPFARIKGADSYSRIPLLEFTIDLDCDVVTQGPGKGTSGEIERRIAFLDKYVKEGSPFFKREKNRFLVYAVLDHGYQLAKTLGQTEPLFYMVLMGRDPKTTVKARDYLAIRMKPEDLSDADDCDVEE